METNNLEYIATADMNQKQIEEWEKDNNAIAIVLDNGERLEFFPTHLYSPDKNGRPLPGTQIPALTISLCNDDLTEEISGILIRRDDDLRRLRNFLNDYLEGRIESAL